MTPTQISTAIVVRVLHMDARETKSGGVTNIGIWWVGELIAVRTLGGIYTPAAALKNFYKEPNAYKRVNKDLWEMYHSWRVAA